MANFILMGQIKEETFWYMQPLSLLLKEEYLKQCSNSCNHGGYSRLEQEKEDIRNQIIRKFGINGSKEYVSKKVLILEEITFDFLNELTQGGFKHYMWIYEPQEQELRKRINIALQAA